MHGTVLLCERVLRKPRLKHTKHKPQQKWRTREGRRSVAINVHATPFSILLANAARTLRQKSSSISCSLARQSPSPYTIPAWIASSDRVRHRTVVLVRFQIPTREACLCVTDKNSNFQPKRRGRWWFLCLFFFLQWDAFWGFCFDRHWGAGFERFKIRLETF